MKHVIFMLSGMAALAVLAIGCENTSGLSEQPRATFSQLACLDNNGDDVLSGADASAGRIPDFNADRERNERDAAFLEGVEIPLDPARDLPACDGDGETQPEYLVAHGFFFDSSDVSCGEGSDPVLLVGVGGGAVDLREKDDAAGVRAVMDRLIRAYEDRDREVIAVVAGPAIAGATNVHAAMEQWLTHAVEVYLGRFPCLSAVLLGHSHGATTVDVVSARLEAEHAARFIAVVDIDRVEELYLGDTAARPVQVPVFNIYETTDPTFAGEPYNSANAENWDATGIEGPEHGEEGGDSVAVNHTTIDNSDAVHDRIVEEVLERSSSR